MTVIHPEGSRGSGVRSKEVERIIDFRGARRAAVVVVGNRVEKTNLVCAVLIGLEATAVVIPAGHIGHIIEGGIGPSTADGVLRNVILQRQAIDSAPKLLAEAAHGGLDKGGFCDRVRGPAHFRAKGVCAVTRLAGADIIDPVDVQPIASNIRRIVKGLRKSCNVDTGIGIVCGQIGEGFRRYAVLDFRRLIVLDSCVVGDRGRRIGGCQIPVEVGVPVGTGLLGDLVEDVRNIRSFCGVELKSHFAVMGAVLVVLRQRKGERGTRVSVVGGFIPNPSRANNDVPL